MINLLENVASRRCLFVKRNDGMYVLNSNFRGATNVARGQETVLTVKDSALAGPASRTITSPASACSS